MYLIDLSKDEIEYKNPGHVELLKYILGILFIVILFISYKSDVNNAFYLLNLYFILILLAAVSLNKIILYIMWLVSILGIIILPMRSLVTFIMTTNVNSVQVDAGWEILIYFFISIIFIFSSFILSKVLDNFLTAMNLIQIKTQIYLRDLKENLNLLLLDLKNSKEMLPGITKKIRKFNSLNRISLDFNKTENINKLLDEFIYILDKDFDPDVCKTIKIESGDLINKDIYRISHQKIARPLKFDELDYLVMEKSFPILTGDIKNDYRFSSVSDSMDEVKSLLIIPVFKEQKAIGTVRLESDKEEYFSIDTLRYIDYLTNLMFINFQNLALYWKYVELAEKDGLTNLYKRWYFDESIKKEVLRSNRYNNYLSFIMIDIDDFSKFNNTYGHITGDRVLKRISEIINNNIPEPGFASRYGGEEIAVILPDINLKKASMIAEDLREKIKTESKLENIKEVITVSIGISEIHSLSEKKAGKLIEQADKALYEAKNTGKDKVVVTG